MATTTEQPRTVLERFPAGAPRGTWPAEEYAAAQHAQGTTEVGWTSAATSSSSSPTPSTERHT